MKALSRLLPIVLAVPVVLTGCHPSGSRPEKVRASAQENVARLGPEDHKLAEEQGYCAVETENRLGSMGVPFKVQVKDQPVFLCCKGCQKEALKDPDATLARVKKLRAQTAAEKTK